MTAIRSQTCISPLTDFSRADVAFAGGKGANLGELTRAGLPVPPGFVIGAPGYAAFCEHTGLRAFVQDTLSCLNVDDTPALESAAAKIHDHIEQTPVPAWLDEAIGIAYDELGGGPVAVGSSATAEDIESASFAGMNETFMNVTGQRPLIDAVRRCWSSLFGARKIFYRAKRGLPQVDLEIAVVVQRQIPSVRAGVMSTVDAASGRADRIVIEGAYGLRESVVSGSVSPDRYVVDKDSYAIVAREVTGKELAIDAVAAGGTAIRDLSGEEAARAVLRDAEVMQLAELAMRIERYYGAAQDIDWAFDADATAWILQSRPVTSSGGH